MTGLTITSGGQITFAPGQTFVGDTSSPSGYGLEGSVTATTGYTAGVYGTSASPTGTGVSGVTTSTASGAFPAVRVSGTSSSPNGSGVEASGPAVGGYGTSGFSTTGYGVEGQSNNVGRVQSYAGPYRQQLWGFRQFDPSYRLRNRSVRDVGRFHRAWR